MINLGVKASVTALVLGLALMTPACSRQDQNKAKQTMDEAARNTEKALDKASDKAKEAWDKTKDTTKDATTSTRGQEHTGARKSGRNTKAGQ